ncbi:Exodeoxyribonuclease VII large subunit [hydrothermal vent metagenome]|uniref:Exodeoxyribonuclease VII large subunit n=1 Tax=hydrothermal vent metagenome TaxID=652676 RepID=A0A1W1CUH5_9ZZZZ
MSNMMTVSSLNTKIKSLLEATFMHTLVEGEVASVTYHTSGHLYFSIKDDKSSIKCVMWRSSVAKMKFRIEKGMHIVVEGSVSVYTPRGEYQFQTVHIEPYGQGALALAYEQLKEKLKQKGYFAKQYKKAIPKYIHKIALVTAKESAALYDMLKIIQKRWPMLEVYIVDTLVQGESAAGQIVKSLIYADTLEADIVIVGRGGGSAEDLWSFNEENVADTLFKMKTPVVSAVGHEVDVLISDFVADLRAPTPSAAIEMILPDRQEVLYTLSELSNRLSDIQSQIIERYTQKLKYNEALLFRSSPLRQLQDIEEELSRITNEFSRVVSYQLKRYENRLPNLTREYTQSIDFLLQRKEQSMESLKQKLQLNHPKNRCKQGWAQISVAGKTVTLSSLKYRQNFILEDKSRKIEAVCMSKD